MEKLHLSINVSADYEGIYNYTMQSSYSDNREGCILFNEFDSSGFAIHVFGH